MAAAELLYYGRLRDEIGIDRELVDLPSHVLSVADLLAWLKAKGDPHASAIGDGAGIRAAIGSQWADDGDNLFGAVEIALMPPVGVL